MKNFTRLMVVLVMAALLSVCALAASPGLNVLTGTKDVMTFDDMATLPTTISNAVLDDSPIAGESGKVLRNHYSGTQTSPYATIGFSFSPALDRTRPYQISFKIYEWANEGYGKYDSLWIMKNGTGGWQIAQKIGGLVANNAGGWQEHSYTVSTFNSLINSSTGAADTSEISKILFEWQYDSASDIDVNQKVYIDDVSIIPAHKITYYDEDGTTVLNTEYSVITESTFTPDVTSSDKEKHILGWSKTNDGTVDEAVTVTYEDFSLYAVYDNNLSINLSADKTLLTESGDTANITSDIWHRNGTDGITLSYSVTEGSSYVTLTDNGDGTAKVAAKAEGMAKITCTASTGETKYVYILVDYQTIDVPTVSQTVPEISASNWLYDHSGAAYDETEGAWAVTKRTDVVKSDDGAGNIVYYNNGFLSKSGSVDTSTYKYLLFRLKADYATKFQVALNVGGSYKYTYPSISATNGEYVDVCADLYTLASGATASQFVLGVTNHHNQVYIKDITLSSIPTYEAEIPEVKSVKLIKTVSEISDDAGSADVEAAIFSNKSSDGNVAWKSDSDCIAIKNFGEGKATLMAMSDGTATITAYAEDDETVYASFDVEVSGQREKQAVYDIRIFFWGASTTKHPPSSSIGWYGNWGMAASSEENDYVHKLVSYLEEKYYPSKVTYEIYAAATLDQSLSTETSTTKDWSTHEQYITVESIMKDFKPNVIVTAMTGNMGSSTPVDVAYNAYKQMYDMMYSYCPDAIVVAQHCGLSCVTRNDELIAQLDQTYSDKVFYDYHVNPAMKLDPNNLATEYADIHAGVAAHWGDKGHDLVATTCFNYISPEIPANLEPSYIYIPEEIEITGDTKVDEKGESLQLAVNVTPNDASDDVIWSVDNSNLATISENGLLSPLANGTVVVTAKSAYDDTVNDTHTVVLTNQLDNFTLTYAAGTTDTVTGLPAADEYASGDYTLSSQIPLRDAYTFVGWGLTENAEETVTTVNVTKPTTVYAVWKKTDGFEFEGSYDESAGFIYGFDIDGGFHAKISDSCIWSTCTAGAKVTFKSPVLDIQNANFVSIALTSAYTDESGAVELTVKTTDGNTTYVFPLATTQYTTFVADISAITGNITGIEVYVNTVTPDSSAFDIGLDYIRFGAVRSVSGNFAITDGVTYVSSSSADGYTELASGALENESLFVSLNGGYTVEAKGSATVYAKAEKEGANVSLQVLGSDGVKFVQKIYTVYSFDGITLTKNEALSESVTSYDLSSLRIVDPVGIRVKASVGADFHTKDEVAEYGFVISKLSTIENGEINDLVLDSEYISTNKVVYGAAFDKDSGVHKIFDSNDKTEFFTAILYNIPMNKTALTTDLVFRPYIRLSDGNILYGTTITKDACAVAVDVYNSSESDEATKAKVKEIINICIPDFDKDIWLDVDNLYD